MVISATEPRYSQSWLGAAVRVAWLGALAFLAWYGWGFAMGEYEQQARVERIELSLQPGQSVVLGRHELAAPVADLKHVRVWRDADGHWSLSNVSGQRQVAWATKNEERQLRHVVLASAETVWVAGQGWTFQTEDGVLSIQKQADPAQVWRFDGVFLTSLVNGASASQRACAGESMGAQMHTFWNRWVPHAVALPKKMDWGGTVACGNRMADDALPRGALHLSRTTQGYAMEANAEAARRVCLSMLQQGICPAGASLYEQALRLESDLRVTLGRTILLTELVEQRLVWTVVARGGWVAKDAHPPQPGPDNAVHISAVADQPTIKWQKSPYHLWNLSEPLNQVHPAWAAGAGMVLLVFLSLLLQHAIRTSHGCALGLSMSLLAMFGSASLWVLGAWASPGWSLIVVGVAMCLLAGLPGPTGWRWASHAMLATMLLIGLALQWALGLQSADTGGWLYFQKTAAFGALGLSALGAMAWWQAARENSVIPLRRPGLLVWETLLMAVGICALLGLGAQVVWGSEAGVWGFQPVELAKLALLLLGAHALAVKLDWTEKGAWRNLKLWLRFVTPVVLFVVLGGVALLSVRDYSPVLLMAMWLLGMLVAWAVVAPSWPAGVLALFIVCAGLMGLNWLHNPKGVDWMQAHGFYGERFAVWLDLLRHPHSGEQVTRALGLATKGGWAGNSLAPAWRVPAVQDDMAPAFVAGRFGMAVVLILWAIQVFYIGCLVMLGWRALRATQQADYRQRWEQRMVFFCATGAATLFAGHLLMSWGTNTGLLPVMGQPMPLVSAGGSVLVLLLIPLHLFWQWQATASGGPRQIRE